jgi:anaphase-promoting complex subunit 3
MKRYSPDAAAVYSVLGNLLEARNDPKRAVECYVAALKLNPFLWDSFERTCSTG